MAVNVKIPITLRSFTSGRIEVTAEGASVMEMIDDLERSYPGIREKILDDEDNLRRAQNIYLNNRDVRFIRGLDTPLNHGDEVAIFIAIAGG